MASPFTAFIAGMGTVVAALGLGFSTVLMFLPSVSQNEPPPQRRAEPAPVELRFVVAEPLAIGSPVITAAQTPMIASRYAAPPPLWAPPRSTTGQASGDAELARDPGVRQIPVRPALSAEAATAAASAQPDAAQHRDAVTAEPPKKKKKIVRKPRDPDVDQGYALAGTHASSYADRRGQPPLGFLGLFLGDSTR